MGDLERGLEDRDAASRDEFLGAAEGVVRQGNRILTREQYRELHPDGADTFTLRIDRAVDDELS